MIMWRCCKEHNTCIAFHIRGHTYCGDWPGIGIFEALMYPRENVRIAKEKNENDAFHVTREHEGE